MTPTAPAPSEPNPQCTAVTRVGSYRRSVVAQLKSAADQGSGTIVAPLTRIHVTRKTN